MYDSVLSAMRLNLPVRPSTIQCLSLVSAIAWFLPDGRPADAADLSFRNDVMPILSKSGCNLGTCHGNARGKGGFQISLRGQDPESDYSVLTKDLFGRRINLSEPDQSLILLKPTMQLAHEGGKRFNPESHEYRVLRDWIAAGMPNDSMNSPRLVSLEVTPDELFLSQETAERRGDPTRDWQFQIQATAKFSDGSTRDVTSLAVYEMAQPIAEISHDGNVVGGSEGETTILVRYLNQQVAVRVAFVPARPDFQWSATEPANFVDQYVFGKLQKLRINPSIVCDDATFIRRVTLDLIGLPPTADEARRFVADTSSRKRQILIDSLLERPEFSDWWALKWADLLRIEEKTLDQKGVENFHAWLRDAFATHTPLDKLVREIVAGRGSTYEVPPANFYRALRTPFERSETVGQLFLGVRLQCSKCHNHPFDRWTQDDYYSWGSVFARIDYKIIENRRRDTNDSHEFDGEQIVYLNNSGEAKDPRVNQAHSAKFLGDAGQLNPDADPLDQLAAWLTDSRHERFVQMLANRTWQQVMGRGIVDPIDDFRATNPASNPALLKALADELAPAQPAHARQRRVQNNWAARALRRDDARENPLSPQGRGEGEKISTRESHPYSEPVVDAGELAVPDATREGRHYSEPVVDARGPAVPVPVEFDLRHLLRMILNSKTYQLASDSNETNRGDEINFSRAIIRRHSAEQLLDAVSQVLDIPLEFSAYPKGRRAAQLPGVAVTRSRDNRQTDADRFLKLFGKPPRLQSCDCERSDETTLGQTFQMVSGPLINRMLATQGNRLDSLLASNKPLSDMITELYWAALTRPPHEDELVATVRFIEKARNRRIAFEDFLWGLLNSNEFLLRR